MSHGATFTRGLLRMRFTFPETPIVYAYSLASFESRLIDGSAANHTGVFTPVPSFLNVSRLRYLCPANAANPIASLLLSANFWDRHSMRAILHGSQTQRAPDTVGTPFAPLR